MWTSTASNKPIPLSLATLRTDEQGVRYALNHFSDCPHAKQHRRPASARLAQAVTAKMSALDLRDLTDYLDQRGLVVVSSEIVDQDEQDGRLVIEIVTKSASGA